MRRAKTEKVGIDRLRASVVLLALATMLLSPLAYGARPYFKAFGADVFTGGWFNSGSSACTTSPNYQDPSPDQTGGIIAFSKIGASQPQGGSSSQFAALSVGSVGGSFNNSANHQGFYSSGATAGANIANHLTLANDAGNLGGRMEGGPPAQGNCIPDYYTTKSTSSTSFSGTATPDVSTATGKYINSSPSGNVSVNSAGGADVIPPGNELTIFVNGNVYIHNNITYSPASTASNVPKFALVVIGSIYIDRSVTQLDGLYIAQPNPAAAPQLGTGNASDTGIIWTCHPNSTNKYTPAQMATNCGTKLTVNGALIAKQVNLLRINGDTAAAAATAGESAGSGNIAEVINYTPAMVLGGPFFNQPSNNGSPKIQSLTSLPPVF